MARMEEITLPPGWLDRQIVSTRQELRDIGQRLISEGSPMAHTLELTTHDMRAIIAHEMLARGADTITITREELTRWKHDATLHATGLEHSIILVAEDADTDLDDAANHDEPVGGFSNPNSHDEPCGDWPPPGLPHSH